jgi:hypothetical protein
MSRDVGFSGKRSGTSKYRERLLAYRDRLTDDARNRASLFLQLGILIMASRMPPVPPASRSNKGAASDSSAKPKEKLVKHERHANAAEEGESANVKQNTTNKGFFHGRRLDK